jgi:hypothetical protein
MHNEILERREGSYEVDFPYYIDVIDARSSDKKGSFQSGLSDGRAVSHGNSFLYFYFETRLIAD